MDDLRRFPSCISPSGLQLSRSRSDADRRWFQVCLLRLRPLACRPPVATHKNTGRSVKLSATQAQLLPQAQLLVVRCIGNGMSDAPISLCLVGRSWTLFFVLWIHLLGHIPAAATAVPLAVVLGIFVALPWRHGMRMYRASRQCASARQRGPSRPAESECRASRTQLKQVANFESWQCRVASACAGASWQLQQVASEYKLNFDSESCQVAIASMIASGLQTLACSKPRR